MRRLPIQKEWGGVSRFLRESSGSPDTGISEAKLKE